MIKYQVNLSVDEVTEINKIRLKSKSLKERQKAGAVYFRNQNQDLDRIAKTIGITKQSIIKHIKEFLKRGTPYITENNYKGHPSELEKYKDIILEDFKKSPPSTIREADVRIQKLTGLKRSWTQITVFLKKTNFLTKNQEVYQQKPIKKNKKSF